jgi:hypothetical protein
LTHFETGGSVVLFVEVMASHPRYVDDCLVEAPIASPVEVYLGFRNLDTGYDWGIPDSDSEMSGEIPGEARTDNRGSVVET